MRGGESFCAARVCGEGKGGGENGIYAGGEMLCAGGHDGRAASAGFGAGRVAAGVDTYLYS